MATGTDLEIIPPAHHEIAPGRRQKAVEPDAVLRHKRQ
jgi:hypothetical protein